MLTVQAGYRYQMDSTDVVRRPDGSKLIYRLLTAKAHDTKASTVWLSLVLNQGQLYARFQ